MAALDAAVAAMTPAQREAELLAAEAVAVGLAAFELGEDAFARGDLTSARRWLTIAARHDAPGAERTLADVDVLINATRTPEAEQAAAGTALHTDPDATEAERIDAAAVLADVAATMRDAEEQVHLAREQAKRILDDAQTRADQILTEARHKAEATEAAHGANKWETLRDVLRRHADSGSDLMWLCLDSEGEAAASFQVTKPISGGAWVKPPASSRSWRLPGPYTGRWARQATESCRAAEAEVAAQKAAMVAALLGKDAAEQAHGDHDTTVLPCLSEHLKAARTTSPSFFKEAVKLVLAITEADRVEWTTNGILRLPSAQPTLWRPGADEDLDLSRQFALNADNPSTDQPPAPAPRQEIVPGPRFREFLDTVSPHRETAVAAPA